MEKNIQADLLDVVSMTRDLGKAQRRHLVDLEAWVPLQGFSLCWFRTDTMIPFSLSATLLSTSSPSSGDPPPLSTLSSMFISHCNTDFIYIYRVLGTHTRTLYILSSNQSLLGASEGKYQIFFFYCQGNNNRFARIYIAPKPIYMLIYAVVLLFRKSGVTLATETSHDAQTSHKRNTF